MLEQIDESLERFLRATVPLAARDIDVSFEPPVPEWSAKLNRPTVNLYLGSIGRSQGRSRSGVETYVDDGVTRRRLALPRAEFGYVVTVWTSDHADERTLLGGLLRAVLSHGDIPAEYLAEPLRQLSPVSLSLRNTGESGLELFTGNGGPLKSSLELLVVSDVDTGAGRPAGAPVREIEVTTTDIESPTRHSTARRVAD